MSNTSQKAGIRIAWPGQGSNVLCILRSRSATHSSTEIYRGAGVAFVDSGSAVANGKIIEYQLYVAETVSPYRSAQSDWRAGFTYLTPAGGLSLTHVGGVWRLNRSAVSWADSYNVYMGSSEVHMPLFASSTTTSYVIGSSLPASPRVFSIRAVNAKGGSPESERIWTTGAPAVASGKPPYACSTPFYPATQMNFEPSSGSLRFAKGLGYGPQSSGDPVNSATGQEVYTPAPDIVAYNPNGVDATFIRSYRSSSAQLGQSSPGLSPGWVHNFNARIYINHSSTAWMPLTIGYANGALEQITPITQAGVPTGQFNAPLGAQYRVSGVHDAAGRWHSISIQWKDGTVWKFSPHTSGVMPLTEIRNSLGHGLLVEYLNDRRIFVVRNLASQTALLNFEYGTDNQLVTVTDCYNRRIWYSSAPSVMGLQHSGCSVLVDASTAKADAQMRASYTYSGAAHPLLASISVPSPVGTGTSTSQIEWGWISSLARTGVTKLIDGNQNQTVFTYGTGTTEVSTRNPAGIEAHKFLQKWSADGRNLGVADIAGFQTSVVYGDPVNPHLPTQLVDAKGRTESYVYDQFANLLSSISRRGLVTSYSISYSQFPLGRLASVLEGSRPPSSYSYQEPSGLLISVTAPKPGGGFSTTYWSYDSLGNVTSLSRPGNSQFPTRVTTFEYLVDGGYQQPTQSGQVLRATDANGASLRFRYDNQGRTIWSEDTLGRPVDFTYDLFGSILTTQYPASGTSGIGRSQDEFLYLYPGGPLMRSSHRNEAGALSRQIDHVYGAEGEKLRDQGSDDSVTISYDAYYRPITFTDASGKSSFVIYTARGHIQAMNGPAITPFTVLAWDASGLATSVADGNGLIRNLKYDDPEDLLTRVEFPQAPSENVVNLYDAHGQMVFQSDESGSHSWSYGAAGELTTRTTDYTGMPSVSLTTAYNPDGSRSTLNTPIGQYQYGYDPMGQVTSLTNPFGEVTAWQYRLDGSIQRKILSTGSFTDYISNPLAERLATLNHLSQGGVLSSFLRTSFSDNGDPVASDSLRPAFTAFGGGIGWSYNAKGELLQETSSRNGGYSAIFQTDSVGNLTSIRGATQTYDLLHQLSGSGFTFESNGNPTQYRGVPLTWSAAGYLRSVGTVFQAKYRADGLRAYKQDQLGNRNYTIYDGLTPLLEMNQQGVIEAVNTFGPNGLVSRRSGGTSTFYTFDDRGGVAERLTASEQVMSVHMHDSYGFTNSSTSTSDPFASFGAQVGYRFDSETGLLLIGHRYYDSAAGRWLSRDPAGLAGGSNAYRYVANNPWRFIDPLGWYQQIAIDPLDLWDLFGPDRLRYTTGDEAVDAIDNWHKPRKKISNLRKEKFWNEELSKGLFERHHVFPKAYRAQFEKVFWKGFIDEKVFKVPQTFHKKMHVGSYGCRGGWWNSQWERFFREADNPSVGDVWRHLERMMKEAGIKDFSTTELKHLKTIRKIGWLRRIFDGILRHLQRPRRNNEPARLEPNEEGIC